MNRAGKGNDMRTVLRRATAAIAGLALVMWGTDGLEAEGLRLWITYATIAIGALLGYYAITGRTPIPPRAPKK